MTTKHTPGPWHYGQESVDPEWWIVTIKGGLIVANVNAHAYQEANARLIAAAPDGLALARAIAAMEDGELSDDEYENAYDAVKAQARALIAKATGDA